MAEFNKELFDWLADREGVDVALELGARDPDADQPGVTAPLRMHATLGPVEDATNTDYDRKAVMVSLNGDEWNRIYFDPATITSVVVNEHGAKVTFHDAFYITLISG